MYSLPFFEVFPLPLDYIIYPPLYIVNSFLEIFQKKIQGVALYLVLFVEGYQRFLNRDFYLVINRRFTQNRIRNSVYHIACSAGLKPVAAGRQRKICKHYYPRIVCKTEVRYKGAEFVVQAYHSVCYRLLCIIVDNGYHQTCRATSPPAPLNKRRLLNTILLFLSLVISNVWLYGIYTLRISYKCTAACSVYFTAIIDRDTISFQRRDTDILRSGCAVCSKSAKPCFTAKV